MRLRADEDGAKFPVVGRFALGEFRLPNFAAAIDVARAESANLAGPGTSEQLETNHGADNRRQVGQGGVDDLQLDRLRLSEIRSPLAQSRND